MYIDELLIIFNSSLNKFPRIGITETHIDLKEKLVNKNYDIQDQAIIEAIIRDDRQTLEEGFEEVLEIISNKIEISNDIEDTLLNNEITDSIIKSLEYTIDFYYNTMVSKHFSST